MVLPGFHVDRTNILRCFPDWSVLRVLAQAGKEAKLAADPVPELKEVAP
jgi:hypothetical protein